jgi:hypothetical protein
MNRQGDPMKLLTLMTSCILAACVSLPLVTDAADEKAILTQNDGPKSVGSAGDHCGNADYKKGGCTQFVTLHVDLPLTAQVEGWECRTTANEAQDFPNPQPWACADKDKAWSRFLGVRQGTTPTSKFVEVEYGNRTSRTRRVELSVKYTVPGRGD